MKNIVRLLVSNKRDSLVVSIFMLILYGILMYGDLR